MNRRQENKIRSFQNTKGVLDNNTEAYQEYPAVVQGVSNFNTNLAEILKIGTQASTDTTGITQAKTKAKDTMATLATEMSGSLKALAFDKQDVQLEAAVDFSYSDIRYASDIDALQSANVIYAEIENNLPDLANYMVSQEDADEFKVSIDEFERLSETKGKVKSTSVSDTKRLAQLIRETDDLLNKNLDQLILRIKRKQPAFYDTYMNARNIIDY